MRFCKIIGLLLLLCLCLSGCSSAREIENQVYALVIGIDKADDDGAIELTIQYPKVGMSASGSSEEGGANASPYLVVSAKGDGYYQALEYLQWSVTRELNMSQSELLIISEELASDPSFVTIISGIAETYHVYTAARVVICEGTAKDFINAKKTLIGSRLSTELHAMFEHLSIHGYILDTPLADVYFDMNSIYSDPMAIWGFVAESSQETEEGQPVASLIESQEAAGQSIETPSSQHYLGTVVFRNGMLTKKLDAPNTVMTSLIRGELENFAYEHNKIPYELALIGRPSTKVKIDGDDVQIRIKVRLTCLSEISDALNEELQNSIMEDILSTISTCQEAQVEPFGFAEKAASHFWTIEEWMTYNWREHFAGANIDADVSIMHANS